MNRNNRVLKPSTKTKKCNKQVSSSTTIDKLLSKLNQIKKLCVEIYGGDQDLLLRDIKQQSIEDTIKNSEDQKNLDIGEESLPPPPITEEEIEELLPLNLNGKIKSKQQIYENIDILVNRSEQRKLYLYKQLQSQPQHKKEVIEQKEKQTYS